MQIVGANPDDLDGVAGRISAASRQLSVLERRMTAQLYATDWQGGDADIFKNAWNTRHRRDIASAVSWLDDADTALRRNAEQQRRTSEAEGSGWLGGIDLASIAAGAAAIGDLAGGGPNIVDALWDFWGQAGDGILILTQEVLEHLLGQYAGPAAILLGGYTVVTSLVDFAFDHEYDGLLGMLEMASDGLRMAGGALAVAGGIAAVAGLAGLVTVGAVPALVVGAGAVVLGGLALAIDTGIDWWVESGREIWRESVAPGLDRGWDMASEGVSSAIGTGTDLAARGLRNGVEMLDRGWDNTYEIGSTGVRTVANVADEAWDVVDGAVDAAADAVGDFAEGIGGAVSGRVKTVAGWF